MNLKKELSVLLKSNFSIINLITREEQRISKILGDIASTEHVGFVAWDCADNAVVLKESTPGFDSRSIRNELDILDGIEKYQGKCVFMLKDYHLHIKETGGAGIRCRRKLRNLAEKLNQESGKVIIILTPMRLEVEELKDDVYAIDVPLPEFQELKEVLENLIKKIRDHVRMTENSKYKLIESALGLTENQFKRIISKILMLHGFIDERSIDVLVQEKKQVIRESGALEFYPVTETVESIGGLDNLKRWLKHREVGFTQEGKDYGLQYPPKGIALIGIPGTGKSLSAKAIAGMWKMPLIRVDMGSVFGSLVGQSEENIRRAINMAETISPCILWIDEIEKAFAGVGGSGDSGTASRVFGHFLNWMQEKRKPVYVVATANNVHLLPGEMWRDGRFDAKFFLNVPNNEERREIFRVHLRKRRPMVKLYDLNLLAEKSENFVGAEIEQAIIDAMYLAINDPEQRGRDFTTDDILEVLEYKTPQFENSTDQVQEILKWAQELGAIPASDIGEKRDEHGLFLPYKKTKTRKLNLNDS